MVNRFNKLIKENLRKVHLSQLYWLSAIVVFIVAFNSCKQEVADNNLSDTSPPSITSVYPENGSTDIPINCTITAAFIEPVALQSLNTDTFSVTQDGNLISGTYSVDEKTAVFTPGSHFQKEKSVTITLFNDITDTVGNFLLQDYTWNFEPTKHPTISSTTPTDGDQDVAINSTIQVSFSEVMDSSTTNTTTFTISDGTDDISGTVSYSGLIATFTPNGNFSEWTEYIATITTGVQDLAGNAMLADHSIKFKTNDTTAPEVVSISPADNATNVSIDTSISVTFSEAIDPTTVTTNTTNTSCSGSLQLSDDNFSTCIQMSCSPVGSNGNKTFEIIPKTNLDSNTNYKFRVTTSIQDATKGNPLVADYTTGYNTEYIQWISSVSPSDNATNVPIDTTITVTFARSMDVSTVTTNSVNTTCSGSLQLSATGFPTCVQMSSAPIAGDGDTSFTIDPFSNLVADTAYTIKVTSDVKDATGGNALTTDSEFNFTTIELIPPQIISVSPANGSTNLAIFTIITAVFDEAINSATITTGTFTISDGSNNISGTIAYSDLTATFTPDSNLSVTTNYSATITTGVEDLAGNALSADYSWTFTTGALPDTGQTTSYTGTFGEDSDYTINPPSYTDNGNGTITDNNTFLMWQQEDDDTTRTWSNASTYCKDSTLGGYTDWRLPSVKELQSIVNYNVDYPSINTTFFVGTDSQSYWSSTTRTVYTNYAWYVDFYNGNEDYYSTSSSYYVRCVRAGSESDIWSSDFLDNMDGTVVHRSTGLTWQQVDDNTNRSWESAITYCEGLSLAGRADWRLPNIRELQTLVDYSIRNPAIDVSLFPNTVSRNYWSSTTSAFSGNEAWGVHFDYGNVFFGYDPGSDYVRCVRAGQ